MTAGRNDGDRRGRSRPGWLSREQCEKLHEASLQVLERTGVRLDEPEAVELVRRAGATVDGDIVRLPAKLIENALATAPREFTIYDREGRPALKLDGSRTYFGPGSDCLHIVDHRSGERRSPVLEDVRQGVTLCDALENIDFAMSLFLPTDVRQQTADRHQMRVLLNTTTKPLIFVTYDVSGCIDDIAMAEAVAGGPAALAERPFLACYINTASGLLHNRDSLEKLLFLAEKGVPVLYIPGSIAGLSGPATVAGSVAMINAGVLAGLVIAQLKREGAPFIVKAWGGGGLDMRTMVYGYAGPDSRRAAEAMGAYYDLPTFALAGASDAKVVDQQAGAEAALTLMADALAGVDLIHDLGYLESGMSGSLAQLAICEETVAWIRQFLAPVPVDDEALALEAIAAVGPAGQFLHSKHTLHHYKEQWYPRLFERDNYNGWQAKGATTLLERAAARVDEILGSHEQPVLPADVDQELARIVATADARVA